MHQNNFRVQSKGFRCRYFHSTEDSAVMTQSPTAWSPGAVWQMKPNVSNQIDFPFSCPCTDGRWGILLSGPFWHSSHSQRLLPFAYPTEYTVFSPIPEPQILLGLSKPDAKKFSYSKGHKRAKLSHPSIVCHSLWVFSMAWSDLWGNP